MSFVLPGVSQASFESPLLYHVRKTMGQSLWVWFHQEVKIYSCSRLGCQWDDLGTRTFHWDLTHQTREPCKFSCSIVCESRVGRLILLWAAPCHLWLWCRCSRQYQMHSLCPRFLSCEARGGTLAHSCRTLPSIESWCLSHWTSAATQPAFCSYSPQNLTNDHEHLFL